MPLTLVATCYLELAGSSADEEEANQSGNKRERQAGTDAEVDESLG